MTLFTCLHTSCGERPVSVPALHDLSKSWVFYLVELQARKQEEFIGFTRTTSRPKRSTNGLRLLVTNTSYSVSWGHHGCRKWCKTFGQSLEVVTQTPVGSGLAPSQNPTPPLSSNPLGLVCEPSFVKVWLRAWVNLVLLSRRSTHCHLT